MELIMRQKYWLCFAITVIIAMVGFSQGCANTTPAPLPKITASVSTPSPAQPNTAAPTTVPAKSIPTITTKDALDLIQKNISNSDFIILDVRTPEEFKSGHIAGAINLDFYSPDFKAEVGKLDRDKQYLVYCRTGARSTSATQIMIDLGFKKVQNMEGGMVQWTSNGYPTVN
jgi:rhodanese-related sulfurtransferase